MELKLSPNGRRYGTRKDPPDHRDFGLSAFSLSATIPPVTDLETFCGPVKDQGALGSCTAFAGCGMRELLYRRLTQFEKTKVDPAPVFSPMFLYYIERELDGSINDGDTGSTGRTCCKALNQFGVCTEADDKYDAANFENAPTVDQLNEALLFKGGAYHRIGTVMDMRNCLAEGYGFIIGFTVYDSFESMTAPFVYNPDKANEQILGGHETLVIGYDDGKSAFKVRNSWGPDFGESGNFWLPYPVAADSDILMDAWMEHLSKAW
jgi:C1A family cysteine protease